MRGRSILCVAGISGALVVAGRLEVSARGTGPGGEAGPEPMPDVIYSDCQSIKQWGAVAGTRGYSLDSHTCNIGDANLLWGTSHDGTPTLAMNAYRLHDGRLEQIGMSWAKHSTNAAAQPGCGPTCSGVGGGMLGVGCLDVYTADFNGRHTILGRRADVNPYTGEIQPVPPGGDTVIDRRLQIATLDLDDGRFPGALYFVEGVYTAVDDAAVFGNANNNATYKRVTVDAAYGLDPVGSAHVSMPAINALRDHGHGVGRPDTSVKVAHVDVPGEGRFVVAAKVTDHGGSWTYDYCVFNLSSDRSGASLTIPVAPGVNVSGIGFHDVDYHSGELFDTTDWTGDARAAAVVWESPASFDEDPLSNALRWATMYTFWFTADAPPMTATAELGLFKPGEPDSVSFSVPAPVVPCDADLDGDFTVGTPDLLIMLSSWGPCVCDADLDDSGEVEFADLLLILLAWGDC
jgi:hypothetical protein